MQFRTAEEATAAIALDGVVYEGKTLALQRPSEFINLDPALGGGALGGIPDTPNKLFIGGLPTYLGDEQVQELLKSFGELRTFNLVKEGAVNGGGSKVSYSMSRFGHALRPH